MTSIPSEPLGRERAFFTEGPQVPAPDSRAVQAAAIIERLVEQVEPETRLGSKDDLRKLCSVSVGTFNEALKIAQARGIITLRRGPGGGIFAAEQSPLVRLGNQMLAMDGKESIVVDALRMRNALDHLTVEDALDHSSAADIEKMRSQIDDMRDAIDADDVRRFLRGNWKFQECVASISPNAMLRTVFLSLLEILEQHTVAFPPVPSALARTMLEERLDLYIGMADALAARDREKALSIMAIHNSGIQPRA